MRFIMMVKSNEQSESGALPDVKALTAMDRYNEELLGSGTMLAGEGLSASSQGGIRVRLARGTVTVVDGPFAETKELLAGYWLIQAGSIDEAVACARRAPFEDAEVEIRPLMGDTGAGSPPPRQPGTTRYVLLIKADQQTEAGVPPDDKVRKEMGGLMQSAGAAVLAGEGLKPTAKGKRVRYQGGKRTVTDGPFAETKELIAGFGMVQFATRAEVVDFATRMLRIHVAWSGLDTGEVEIRRVMELEDLDVGRHASGREMVAEMTRYNVLVVRRREQQ